MHKMFDDRQFIFLFYYLGGVHSQIVQSFDLPTFIKIIFKNFFNDPVKSNRVVKSQVHIIIYYDRRAWFVSNDNFYETFETTVKNINIMFYCIIIILRLGRENSIRSFRRILTAND